MFPCQHFEISSAYLHVEKNILECHRMSSKGYVAGAAMHHQLMTDNLFYKTNLVTTWQLYDKQSWAGMLNCV